MAPSTVFLILSVLFFLKKESLYFSFRYIYFCVSMHMYVHVVVRGQLAGITRLFPSHRFQDSGLGLQASLHASVPTEPPSLCLPSHHLTSTSLAILTGVSRNSVWVWFVLPSWLRTRNRFFSHVLIIYTSFENRLLSSSALFVDWMICFCFSVFSLL